MKFFPSIVAVVLCAVQGVAQTADYKTATRVERYVLTVNAASLDTALLRDACLFHINKELEKNDNRTLAPNATLQRVAQQFADYIAKTGDVRPENAPKKMQLSARLIEAGAGVHQSNEVAMKLALTKGEVSYADIAQEFAAQLFRRKSADVLLNPTYIFAGVGCAFDKEKKKVYINVALGNYNLITMSKKDIKKSGLPVSKSTFGMKNYDAYACKQCDKYPNISSYWNNLSVVNGEVYFTTTEYRSFKRLLKGDKDGLAIDLVMRAQFPCNAPNILNTQVPNRGYMLKPVFAPDFAKKNIESGKIASTKLSISLGAIPENIPPYEIHLMIIKDGFVCKNIFPVWNKKFENISLPPITAFPDTVTKYNTFIYKPKATIDTIRFRIPFEAGRATYQKEDIQAFVDSLRQPTFRPLSICVTAFTSIEGDSAKNNQLRDARIASITQALKQFSGSTAPITTRSSDSWSLFFKDIVGTEFQFLRTKSKEVFEFQQDGDTATRRAVLEFLRKGDNLKKMEPILAKHRFAEVEIIAEYSIATPEKEEAYVVFQFNRALENYDVDKALAIQKFIIKQVLSKRYSTAAIDNMQIALKPQHTGLEMNRIWLRYAALQKPTDLDFLRDMRKLFQLNTDNVYVKRNLIYARLLLETIDSEYYVTEMQKEIDALLISPLPKYTIDPLNLELQIKSLNALGKTLKVANEDEFVAAAFARIREIVEIDKNDWQAALNQAAIFAGMGEFDYPLEIMGRMITNPDVSEDFIFTFLAMSTTTHYMHHTQAFVDAMNAASNVNKNRYCELLDSGTMSIFVLQNPLVKQAYCEVCNH
ncbi:MAG: hypothetical protein LBU90_09375 [Bacteroidales bacterium]|jgi:uncharacterized protein YkwD|nr:hypothetical protein [Bacteroidales bacterium]